MRNPYCVTPRWDDVLCSDSAAVEPSCRSAAQCLGCGTYPRRTLAHIVTDSPVAAFIFDNDTP